VLGQPDLDLIDDILRLTRDVIDGGLDLAGAYVRFAFPLEAPVTREISGGPLGLTFCLIEVRHRTTSSLGAAIGH
jgi:hypothetical protein